MSDHQIKMFDKEIRESKSSVSPDEGNYYAKTGFCAQKYLPTLANHATMWELKWFGHTDCAFLA